jgi:hypothetical protein
MPDVAYKCFANQPARYGTVVMGAMVTGNAVISNLRPSGFTFSQFGVDASGYEVKLTNRFDDPTYYSN